MSEFLSANEWSTWLAKQQDVHLLQTAEWGNLKQRFGWTPIRIVNSANNTGAQILFRKLLLGFHIAYIAKGPVGNAGPDFWNEIDAICLKKRTVFCKVEPDGWDLEDGLCGNDAMGFLQASSIQPRRTVVVDLSGNESDWLNRMKPKTRYNIRLAEKKDVEVNECDQVDVFYDIMVSTGNRDQFGIHSLDYYRYVYQLFSSEGKVILLMAYFLGQPLAGLMAFREGKRAWYFYGASNEIERNRMPTYLLQFKAMQWAAANGCSEYDLWGIPDFDEEFLEANFQENSSGLWGVYRFKRGFGGAIKRYLSASDRVYIPFIYSIYKRFLAGRNSIG